jgi:hypothetical protein
MPQATCDLSQILQLASPTTKSQFELVITRHSESLDWLQPFQHLATIYNKGPDAPPNLPLAQIQNVPNKGLGAETMLRHIITRYDSLADVTFFAQGAVADRPDQPLYPLSYYQATPLTEARGYLTDAYDKPKSRYLTRADAPCIGNHTLEAWRTKVVGLPYKYLQEFWVRGDWIAVGREAVRSKPLPYYKYLYQLSEFGRGIWLEECWYWERTFWVLFTRKLPKSFQFPSTEKDVLLLS